MQEAFAAYNAMRNRVRLKNAQRPVPEPSSEPVSKPVDRRTGTRLRCWLCGSRGHLLPKCPKKPEHFQGREVAKIPPRAPTQDAREHALSAIPL